jgi:hypothetical protein
MRGEQKARDALTTTQDTHDRATAKQEIIEQLDELSLQQLGQVLALINALRGLPKGVSGSEFVDLMLKLRETCQITDEEAEEFDRILREGHEAEKRRLAAECHESALRA